MATGLNNASKLSGVQVRGLRSSAGRAGIEGFAISLIGSFGLWYLGRPVELPRRAQKLLAILALRGQTSRSRLAGMLWPEATEDRALASLRTGLWRVQTAAPEVLVAMGCTVEVDPRVQVDVREFVDQATRALRDGRTAAPIRLEDVYQGDLLADWDDEWLTSDRERLRQLRLHLMETLSDQLARDGRFGLAVEFALAALREDILRESAHRAVICAYLAEGNISEAHRAFVRCAKVLEEELGVEPSPRITELLPRRIQSISLQRLG
jgi:DNA-binding SARP family transcriptional activator